MPNLYQIPRNAIKSEGAFKKQQLLLNKNGKWSPGFQ
ncbi:Uncharacterised protein [Serratia grimesii]|jgi:hypothetical protein|nr:Uncharacterised protein [Serratia grimesii]CAI2790388.1 Uncharacterised protein [Serratia grimesii]